METIKDIDLELVRNLIDEQFPQWSGLELRPVVPQGWDNRTFRLGQQFSVRLPSAACYAPQIMKEQAWLPRLAPNLPLTIPKPVATGNPTNNFSFHWSIREWIDGESVTIGKCHDFENMAQDAAGFLSNLHRIDASSGPKSGPHNFHRGGELQNYDAETRWALNLAKQTIDFDMATEVWETALASQWNGNQQGNDVWVHGDFAPSNLLAKDGALNAVIDFGGLAVGDPACDLTLCWTLFSGKSADTFRSCLPFDEGMWSRARGWALWKALLIVTGQSEQKTSENAADDVIEMVLRDSMR